MVKLFKYLVASLAISTCSIPGNEPSYTCSMQLNDVEIMQFSENKVVSVENNKEVLTAIQNILAKTNAGKDDLRINWRRYSENESALNIYGVDNFPAIDTVSCIIFTNSTLNLPRDLILFFMTDDNASEKEKPIAVLKRKYYR